VKWDLFVDNMNSVLSSWTPNIVTNFQHNIESVGSNLQLFDFVVLNTSKKTRFQICERRRKRKSQLKKDWNCTLSHIEMTPSPCPIQTWPFSNCNIVYIVTKELQSNCFGNGLETDFVMCSFCLIHFMVWIHGSMLLKSEYLNWIRTLRFQLLCELSYSFHCSSILV
jgi:hypothetical protein